MDLTYHKKPAAFVAANPDCTFEEFQKATGCTKQSWYDARYRINKSDKPVTKRPVKDTTKFILANPNATFEEFKEKFGDDKKEYGQARHRAKSYMELRGLKNLIKPFRAKWGSLKAKREEAKAKKDMFKQERPEEDRLETAYERDGVKRMEGTVSLGTTPEFIWYESTIIRNDFSSTMNRFERLVRVMEARQADNNKMLDQVLRENERLRRENRSLNDLLDTKTKPGA